MGYNTRFQLTLQLILANQVAELVDDSPFAAIIEQLREGNENAKYCLDSDGGTEEAGKWYEYEKDLREFSLNHPNILFTLLGEGEENEDVWRAYFLNGKVQIAKAKMTIAPFDPKELR